MFCNYVCLFIYNFYVIKKTLEYGIKYCNLNYFFKVCGSANYELDVYHSLTVQSCPLTTTKKEIQSGLCLGYKTTLFLCLLFCNFRQSTDLSSAAAAEPQTSSTQHHPKNGHRPDWTRFHSLGALHGCVRRPHGAPRALRGRREAARQVCAQLPLIRFCFLFCFCFVITYPL